MKANVWSGLVIDCLIGFHSFDQSLNANRSLNFIQNDFLGWIENFDLELRSLIYMQDGVPSHRARIITTYLNEHFPNKWISHRSPYVQWPPRFPDLTPLDFYLWGYLKTGYSNTYRITRLTCSVNSKRMLRCKSWCEHNTKCYKHSSASFELYYDNSSGYFEKFL